MQFYHITNFEVEICVGFKHPSLCSMNFISENLDFLSFLQLQWKLIQFGLGKSLPISFCNKRKIATQANKYRFSQNNLSSLKHCYYSTWKSKISNNFPLTILHIKRVVSFLPGKNVIEATRLMKNLPAAAKKKKN